MEQTTSRRTVAGVLTLCFLLSTLARGTSESFTVYLLPISISFGWDRAETLTIYSMLLLAQGLSGPFIGRLFDRAGPRTVYACGLLLTGAGFCIGSYAQTLWQLQLSLGLALGFGGACVGLTTGSLLLSRWFGPKLPAATALIYAAAGVGVMTMVPLSQILIDRFEWRDACRITGVAMLALTVPIMLMPWRRLAAGAVEIHAAATSRVTTDNWTLRSAMRNRAFWGLFATFFFTGLGMSGISIQVVAYLVDAGFPPLQAASAWGFSGVTLFVGLVAVGWLDTLIGRFRTLILAYTLTTIGLVMLWLLPRYPTPWLLFGFLVCFGCTIGSRGPLITATAMQIFRGKHLGAIFGTISIGPGLGASIGAWIGGLIHDFTQGYDWVIVFAIASVWIAALPFLTERTLREA